MKLRDRIQHEGHGRTAPGWARARMVVLGEEGLFAVGEHLADLEATERALSHLQVSVAKMLRALTAQRTEAMRRRRYFADVLRAAGHPHLDPSILTPGGAELPADTGTQSEVSHRFD